jgi:WD40 repeat protein
MLAAYGSDGTIYLWRIKDGIFLRALQGNPSYGGDLKFSPDGKYLIASSDDGALHIFGVAESKR